MSRTSQWAINIGLWILIFASCKSVPAKVAAGSTTTKIQSYATLERRIDDIFRRVCQLEIDCADGSPIMTTKNGVVVLPEKFDPVIEHSEIKDDSETKIVGGLGVTVQGHGTDEDPYVLWNSFVDTTIYADTIYSPYQIAECKHIWVQEYVGNVAQIGIPIVCLKCLKQDVRTWEWTPLVPSRIEPLQPLPAHPIMPYDILTTGTETIYLNNNTSDCEENCYEQSY